MLEYVKRLITPDMVSFWVPSGLSRAIDLIRDNHGQCYGTHPNVPVLPSLINPAIGWWFGGDDDYVNISNNASLRPIRFTIAAWIKTTNADNQEIFQTYYQSTTVAGIEFRQIANKLQLVSGRNTGVVLGTDHQVVNSTVNINDGEWHLVAGVYDGTDLILYIDGEFDNSQAWAHDPGYDIANNRINIGVNNYTGSTFITWWDGYIALPFIANKAWSVAQVKNDHLFTKGMFAPRG